MLSSALVLAMATTIVGMVRQAAVAGGAKAIENRHFDAPGVRDVLELLDVDELIERIGEPRHLTDFAGGDGGRFWHVGMGKPVLVELLERFSPGSADDPAIQQAIGRCAISRIRGKGIPDFSRSVHAEVCSWCEYPLEQLLAVCEWATYIGRFVDVELLVWDGENRSTYIRRSPVKGYTNPAHVQFWGQKAPMRAHRIAVAAGTEKTLALEVSPA